MARELALAIPPAAINFGAIIEGVQTDPVTFLLYTLGNRFADLEDERSLSLGTQLLNFTARPGERIDSTLTRFDLARAEAQTVGAGIQNFHTLTTVLLRVVRVTGQQMITLLQPFGGRMPNSQAQFDHLFSQFRSMGHILERAPGNIATTLNAHGNTGNARTFITDAAETNSYEAVPTEEDMGTYHASGVSPPSACIPRAAMRWQSLPQSDILADTFLGSSAGCYDSGTDSDTASSRDDQDHGFSDLGHLAWSPGGA